MNIFDLSIQQLKRAASIKEQIDSLTNELQTILGVANNGMALPRRTMSSAARAKIAAAQRERWAKTRNVNPDRTTAKPAKKREMSAAAKAKLSARMKAFWKSKKAGKKTANTAK